MRDFIIQIVDYNGNDIMSFRICGVSDLMRLRDLHDCSLADTDTNEDGDTIFRIQSEDENVMKS